MIQYRAIPMPVTIALTSHTSPLAHQAIARPTGAITQV
ncbi:hypothetical protein SPURM210S_05573 [Streptomyces purpurascens]